MATRVPSRRRRRKGTGSVYQRSDGLFIGEITVEGERRTVSGSTYEEADQRLSDLAKNSSWIGSTGEVGEYLKTWQAKIRTSGEVTERTQIGYEQLIRCYITPAIGKTKMKDLSVPQVQRMLDGLRLHANSRRNVRACLSSALADAVRQGLIPVNVAGATRVKGAVKSGRTPGAIVSIDERGLKKVGEALDGNVVGRVITLIMHTGVRKQDALALDWKDVDFDRNVIRFHRALKKGHAGYYIGPPKSAQGNREIPMSPSLWLSMALWSTDQETGEVHTGPVFPSPRPRRPGAVPHPDWISHQFTAMLKTAGLPHMRVHDLRHAFASSMLAKGIDHVRVARIMGHGPEVLMRIYAHVSTPNDQAAFADVDYILPEYTQAERTADEASRAEIRRLMAQRQMPMATPKAT